MPLQVQQILYIPIPIGEPILMYEPAPDVELSEAERASRAAGKEEYWRPKLNEQQEHCKRYKVVVVPLQAIIGYEEVSSRDFQQSETSFAGKHYDETKILLHGGHSVLTRLSIEQVQDHVNQMQQQTMEQLHKEAEQRVAEVPVGQGPAVLAAVESQIPKPGQPFRQGPPGGRRRR